MVWHNARIGTISHWQPKNKSGTYDILIRPKHRSRREHKNRAQTDTRREREREGEIRCCTLLSAVQLACCFLTTTKKIENIPLFLVALDIIVVSNCTNSASRSSNRGRHQRLLCIYLCSLYGFVFVVEFHAQKHTQRHPTSVCVNGIIIFLLISPSFQKKLV